jgi:glycosyltransferase involved in cell wall biosynthesis
MRPSHIISVIIPTYNEATYLPATLDSVAGSNTNKEVIVVDAGSADGTSDLARAREAHVLLSQRRQRAYQMNLGASHAHGAVLLFLHADTVLPTAALDHIASSLSENGIVGGGFARRYNSDSWFLRTTCLFADLRTRWQAGF